MAYSPPFSCGYKYRWAPPLLLIFAHPNTISSTKKFLHFFIYLVKIPKVLNPMKEESILEKDITINNNVDMCSAKIRRVQVLYLLPEPLPPHYIPYYSKYGMIEDPLNIFSWKI